MFRPYRRSPLDVVFGALMLPPGVFFLMAPLLIGDWDPSNVYNQQATALAVCFALTGASLVAGNRTLLGASVLVLAAVSAWSLLPACAPHVPLAFTIPLVVFVLARLCGLLQKGP